MTQLTVMTPQDPNIGLTNARLRLTNKLPLKDPVGINDNHKTQHDQQSPPLSLMTTYNKLPLTRTSLPLWHQWQRVDGWKKLDAEEE